MTTRKRRKNGIQQCRKAAGFKTAAELSERTDIPQNTIESWEQGYAFPRFDQVTQLADLFDCSIDELYGRHTRGSFPAEAKGPDVYAVDLSSLNEAGRQSVRLLVDLLEGGDLELYNSKLPELMTLINRSLAQRRGDGGGRSVSAEAV